jgi:hypothetical protein
LGQSSIVWDCTCYRSTVYEKTVNCILLCSPFTCQYNGIQLPFVLLLIITTNHSCGPWGDVVFKALHYNSECPRNRFAVVWMGILVYYTIYNIYNMTRYFMIRNDILWYIYKTLWYDKIGYDIWYTVWYDIFWYMIQYMIYKILHVMTWYGRIWYDIWYMV